jgi:hypothetical protein
MFLSSFFSKRVDMPEIKSHIDKATDNIPNKEQKVGASS